MNRILKLPCRNGAHRWQCLRQHPFRQTFRYQSSQPQPKPEPIEIPVPLPWHQRLGPVTQFVGWFHRAQHKRPLTVQTTAAVLTFLFGDLLAQEIGGEDYDASRTLRMVVIGGVAAPASYKWFMLLGRNFNYTSKWLSIAAKTAVQQAVFTPVNNTYFFGMQAIMTGEPPSGVLQRIKDAVPTSIINSAKFWPFVTAFSFAFIMPQYRLMFSGMFAICWQSYLSILNRRAEKGEMIEPVPTVKA